MTQNRKFTTIKRKTQNDVNRPKKGKAEVLYDNLNVKRIKMRKIL